jgi:gas vesicle protein
MRDDRDVTVIESDGGGFRWFLLGAVLGAGLGLLFAPQAGERTRRDIARRARRLRAEAEERFEDLGDEVRERGRAVKETAEELVDKVGGEIRDGRQRIRRAAADARDDLERRLAEARARRRAAVGADGVEADDDSDDVDEADD